MPGGRPCNINVELTPREREFVTLMAMGVTAYKDIAEKMQITGKSVAATAQRVFDKTGLSSKVDVALWAATHADPERVAARAQLIRDLRLHALYFRENAKRLEDQAQYMEREL